MSFLTKENRSRKFEVKYFAISHGQNQPAPNHVKCLVPDPSKGGELITKYIEKHPALKGRVIDCAWYVREDKKNERTYRGYELTFDIYDEIITLDVPFKQPPTSMYSLLVKHGENVDWTKELELSVWEDKVDAKRSKNGVCFWQVNDAGERVTIKAAHTVENPNGCPAPMENEMTGKPDWGNVDAWLKKNFDNVVIPRIQAAAKDYQPIGKVRTDEVLQDEEDFDQQEAYDVPEFAGDSAPRMSERDQLLAQIRELLDYPKDQPAMTKEAAAQLKALNVGRVGELSDAGLGQFKTGLTLWRERQEKAIHEQKGFGGRPEDDRVPF